MLPKSFDKNMEQKWQKFWQDNRTYEFDDAEFTTHDSEYETGNQKPKIRNPRPIYSIDTPPPFTSGELHMGHVLSYSYFDFVARYRRMRGFNVYYPQGWDTQGFPTEVKVEKKYGRLPPVEFRQKCIEWTREFIAKMKQQMIEMGFSPDWKYEYRTMEPDYHRKVQLSLIEMYDKKMIYRAKYPVYWCTTCGSAIAKAELDDEPKSGTLFYIKFTAKDGKELVIATTRPELIPACVAVLYNPEDERYKQLKGKTALTPLGKEVPIIADAEVDKEFGSGLVQVCTFGDKMDVVWMHRYKLPLNSVINKYGKMENTGISELDGLKLKDAKTKIVELLEKQGKVLNKKPLQQTVKVHDRCKTPIELLASWQWFADIRTTGKKIKELAHKVKWAPDFGISYLIDWVEGAEWDWVISRQRVFGTPIPFFYCEKCGETKAEEIAKLPFYAEKTQKQKCRCGGDMTAETSTCDCWVDSSITPLIISGWPDDKKKFEKLYPNSLRPQGVEIVRTWAFYTIYRSGVGITEKQPWETILLNGNVLAPDGKKMSKSLGNIISPTQLQQEYPTDAIRQWAAMSGAMAKDRPFSYEDIKYAKSFLNKLWNASKLVELSIVDYDGEEVEFKKLSVIDRWMISRMNQIISESTEAMEKFEFHVLMNKMHNFFWKEFCDDYLEYVKHRIYGEDKEKKHAAQYVLHYVLLNSIKLLAPIAPHMTEEIYSEVFKGKISVHRSEWPAFASQLVLRTSPSSTALGHSVTAAGASHSVTAAVTSHSVTAVGKIDEKSVAIMNIFNSVVSEVRQHKAKNKIAQNAEIDKIKMSLPELFSTELVEELKAISKIKKVEQEKGELDVEF